MNGTPGYLKGFYDASNLEPLFDDASEDYRAGWLGYQEALRAFARARELVQKITAQ
jgi:hypothetical protein